MNFSGKSRKKYLKQKDLSRWQVLFVLIMKLSKSLEKIIQV